MDELLSDEELLTRSQKEPALFVGLVDRYQAAFTRKAEKIIGSREDALDIVQDVFVKIYLKAATFKKREGAGFKAWAYKILINTCFSYYRKNAARYRRQTSVEPEFFELVKYEDPEFSRLETKDYILSLLSKLPALLKRTAWLHFIDNKDHREIAETEGVSEGVVRTRLYRAKKMIKEFKTSAYYE